MTGILFWESFPATAGAAGSDLQPGAVHPIYAQLQDAPQNRLALQRFQLAALRFGLGPVEIVDIEGDPPPHPAEKLRAGIELVRKLDFGSGRAALDAAADEVAGTGGGGLEALALSDLFLFRAWAISRADFNPEHPVEPTARAQAYGELLRAVMLTPSRLLNPKQYPPLLLEDWARAAADLASASPSTLVVHATPDALVSCDGGAPIPGPATFVGLAPGEHLVHVEEPGWVAWGATLSVNQPSVALHVPARRALTLADGQAAARARRMGARFALVAEPRPGQQGGLSVSLRLVDASGARRDAAIAPLAGEAGAFDAAVMRMDEQARRLDRASAGSLPAVAVAVPVPPGPGETESNPSTLSTLPPAVLASPPPPPRPRLSADPGAWARTNWPLLTAVGAMLGAALILSITMAADR